MRGAASLGVPLAPAQVAAFESYADTLQTWSGRLNLTRIESQEDIVGRHFLDSLACLQGPALPNGSIVIDIGSGAGFPGVPLKIARPDVEMTLLDASRRRVAFLELLVGELGIRADVLHGRAEALSRLPERRERYDLAVSRATAPLARLAGLCLPFVRLGGWVVLPKGPGLGAEAEEADPVIRSLGGRVAEVRLVTIPGLETHRRVLVILEKITKVPDRNPAPRPIRPAPPSR